MTACEARGSGEPGGNTEPSVIRKAFDRHFRIERARSCSLIEEVQRLRYQVYCIEHPFEDPAEHPDGLEQDNCDGRSIHALVRHVASGECAAVVRLVLAGEPTRDPFPIEAHCAAALYPEAQRRIARLPRPRVAEISRLAVSRNFKRRLAEAETVGGVSDQAVYADARPGSDTLHQRGFPHITVGLFAAIVQLSVEAEVTHWLAVMEPTLLRLLRRFGIRFQRIGADVDYHGRRRPTLGVAAEVVDGILAERPDIWDLVTQGGRYVPPRL